MRQNKEMYSASSVARSMLENGNSIQDVLGYLSSKGFNDGESKLIIDIAKKNKGKRAFLEPKRLIISGLITFILGVIITFGTFSLAKSNPHGGIFIIAYGAIIGGFIQLIPGLRGIAAAEKIRHFLTSFKSFVKVLMIIFASLFFGLLTSISGIVLFSGGGKLGFNHVILFFALIIFFTPLPIILFSLGKKFEKS